MYRGFNITFNQFSEDYYKKGLEVFKIFKQYTTKHLDKYVGIDGEISSTELENDWFKEMDAHIFISHSHNDTKAAIALAGYLADKHEIICFVDSCVWGYANDLLRKIDNKYCKHADN